LHVRELTHEILKRRGQRLALAHDTVSGRGRRGIVRERGERGEERRQLRIKRRSGHADRRFDAAKDLRHRRVIRGVALLPSQARLHQLIAHRPHGHHFDTATGAGRTDGRHFRKLQSSARIARRIDVRDVLTHDVQTHALRNRAFDADDRLSNNPDMTTSSIPRWPEWAEGRR
jgi:hypothetical protein